MNILIKYINDRVSFEELMSSIELYNIVSNLLKRNGIYPDRLPREEFYSTLYVVMEINRDYLREEVVEKSAFSIVSLVSNLILKYINRDLYRREQIRKREIKREYLINNLVVMEEKFERICQDVDLLFQRYDLKYRIALGLYFGLDREYFLSVDEICSIIRVKRSTLFFKINELKRELCRG